MTAADLAARLPEIADLRARSKAIAMLDAIQSDDYPCFRYDAHWAEGEEMASMDNGSGDGYSIVFAPHGAFVRGFDHESPMSPFTRDPVEAWPGVLDEVPEFFRSEAVEPAFTQDGVPATTVCLWRSHTDSAWRTGEVIYPEDGDDGSGWLFDLLLSDDPKAYQDYAASYFETDLPIEAIAHVYALRPLTSDVLARLNPERTLEDLEEAVAEIGYPVTAEDPESRRAVLSDHIG